VFQLIPLLFLIVNLPLSAGCSQSSTAQVAPEDAALERDRKYLQETAAQTASSELWYYLSRKRSQVTFTKQGHADYIRRINYWIDRGGKIGEGRIACLKRSKKINDEVVKILRGKQ
jgi:hypothetical protein